MKKSILTITSLILTAVFLCSSAIAVGFADHDCENTPVIMVSGFGATKLVELKDDGGEELAFPFNGDSIIKVIKNNIKDFNKDDPLAFVAAVVAGLVEPISMHDDGTSVYNLKPVYQAARDTSLAGFKANDALDCVPYAGSEFLDMQSVSEKVGDDHVFNFMYDWRLSSDYTADLFLTYIQEVMALTGHDKVSVYCLSQGSVSMAQYLYKYADKGYIERIVFDNPIFEGSDFVASLFSGKDAPITLNFQTVLKLLSNILHTEIDITALADVIPQQGAGDVVKYGAEELILPLVKNSAAYVEMIPNDKFNSVCENYFSSPDNAKLIEQANLVRNGYMKNIEKTLRSAQSYGTTVSIVSCSGVDLITGDGVQSDGIVNLSTSCGAYCAPFGETFSSTYTQQKDIGKNCISPDRKIDLSCGYLPERTWVINERFHGQVEWAPNSLELVEALLYTNEIESAWSNAKYPQFMQSNDPNLDLYANFASTNCLYETLAGSGRLIIKNVSNKHTMLIKKIDCDVNMTSCFSAPFMLKPGEKIVVKIDTSNQTTGKLTIDYCEADNSCKAKTREFDFSISDSYSGQISDKGIVSNNITVPNKVFSALWSISNTLFALTVQIINQIILYIKGA